MKPKPHRDPAALRRTAEERQRARPASPPQTKGDLRRIQHELEVHQIELEMQNEELRTAQAEIEAGLERYTDLYDFAPVAYFNLTAEGTIRLVNLTGAKLVGLERSRLLGRSFGLLLPEADRRTLSDCLAQVFATEDRQTCELTLTPSERPVTFLRLEATRSLDGTECRAALLDLTAQKRAEEQVRETEAIERVSAAKSEFLSRMSHELRTPLHAILGFAQLMETHAMSHEDQDGVAQILRAGEHLLVLINEVLEIAQFESGELALTAEPVGVREALEEALSLVKPQAAAARVRLEPLVGDMDGEVLSNAQRLRQILLNLLSNAVKFNREGGTVAVACAKVEDRLRIKVENTGRGIAPENLPRLFMPFERFEKARTDVQGAGLGLSLSKQLIEAMGGRIGVESEPGQSATFWIELPLVQAASPAITRSLSGA